MERVRSIHRTSTNHSSVPKSMPKRRTFSKLTIFLSIVFLLGILCGSLILNVSSQEKIKALGFIFESFVQNRAGQSILTTFFHSFLTSFLPVLVVFLFGFSAISAPFTIAVCYVRGLGMGMAMSFLYQNHGLMGFLYCLALVIPYASVAMIALIAGSKKSILFSDVLFRYLFLSEKNSSAYDVFKIYCYKYIPIVYLVVLSALVDMVMSFLFSHFFVFQ